jgi:guanylate kinase
MGAPGLLLVLSAPSGAGKTTLAHRFRESEPDALFSVSATTRAPRGAERDGVDYHFVSAERFDRLVEQGALAEWAEVHGNRYGTLRATVEQALAAGRIALFDIDVQGGAQIQATWPRQTASVFVVPPSMAELERRLRGRGTDSEESIGRRLRAAWEELERGSSRYDYVVVNDQLDRAAGDLAAIVRWERARLAGAGEEGAVAAVARLRSARFDLGAWRNGR